VCPFLLGRLRSQLAAQHAPVWPSPPGQTSEHSHVADAPGAHLLQVILKPDPGNSQELYLGSLQALGIDTSAHDVRFVEDNWESPVLGAWGLGWEVWLDGMEVTQFTYFQQAGGWRGLCSPLCTACAANAASPGSSLPHFAVQPSAAEHAWHACMLHPTCLPDHSPSTARLPPPPALALAARPLTLRTTRSPLQGAKFWTPLLWR
jgi:hypothetical protein